MNRIEELLSGMTREEKIAQLCAVYPYELMENGRFSPAKADSLLKYGIGQISRPAGATTLRLEEVATFSNALQDYLRENTRLKIPALMHEECCSGFQAWGATVFPQAIGLASCWEPSLAEKMTRIIRDQMRAVGSHMALAPVLDVARDPRWGRVEETFGEDPYLTSLMGCAFIRGLQGDDLKQGIMATGKHFAAHALPQGGLNHAPVHMGAREFFDEHITPFAAAIREAGLCCMMNAYHEIDGQPCASSRELLTDLLCGRLGFDGVVVSDYFSVDLLRSRHHIAADKKEAAALALEAGIDLELPSVNCYGAPLAEALEKGMVSEEILDRAVRHMLESKERLGLFDSCKADPDKPAAVFDTGEQRSLAREIAVKSMVLLKNEGNLLPLSKDLTSIALIGPNAHNIRNMFGDYSYPTHIEILMPSSILDDQKGKDLSGMRLPERDEELLDCVKAVTPLEGLREALSPETEILYARGCDITGEDRSGIEEAVEIAERAQAVVVILGGCSGLVDKCTSGENRDRTTLGLLGVQEELIRAVHATGTPTVAVYIDGRPIASPWVQDNIPAVVEAWLPGEEGGHALWDVLLGRCSPSGKLPISFPRNAGQIPIYYRQKPTGANPFEGGYVDEEQTPLYPFGHGLSYTDFEYSDLNLPEETSMDKEIEIALTVKNCGGHRGIETVQLYLRDRLARITRPVKELKGIAKAELNPGEAARVRFSFQAELLGFTNETDRFVVEPGETEVMIGSSSEDIRLEGRFRIDGKSKEIESDRQFFSSAFIERLQD